MQQGKNNSGVTTEVREAKGAVRQGDTFLRASK